MTKFSQHLFTQQFSSLARDNNNNDYDSQNNGKDDSVGSQTHANQESDSNNDQSDHSVEL